MSSVNHDSPPPFSFMPRRSGREADLDQIELRYQAVQCHIRAQRVTNDDDARWLQELAVKLVAMADVEDGRQLFYASGVLRECA